MPLSAKNSSLGIAHTNLKVLCTYTVHSHVPIQFILEETTSFINWVSIKLVWTLTTIKFLNYFIPLFCSNAFALHRKNLVHAEESFQELWYR